MNEFQAALAAFLAGRAEFAQLDAALLRTLQAEPAAGPAAYAAIDDLRRSGRLPLQLFVVLKNRIAQSHGTAAQRPAPPRQDPQPQAQPPPRPQPRRAGRGSGGDRTVFGAQRPRHGTGSSGPTNSSAPPSSSHPPLAPAMPPSGPPVEGRASGSLLQWRRRHGIGGATSCAAGRAHDHGRAAGAVRRRRFALAQRARSERPGRHDGHQQDRRNGHGRVGLERSVEVG